MSRSARPPGVLSPLPSWLQRVVAYGIALLVLVLVAAVVVLALLEVGLVSFALLAALLLAALLAPVAHRLRQAGAPPALAALVSIVVLLGVPTAIGVAVWSSVATQVDELGPAVREGIRGVRDWLVEGPLGIDEQVVADLGGSAAVAAEEAAPGAVAGTTTAAMALTGVALVVFAVFFLVKDGQGMWGWALRWVPAEHRERVDGGGRVVWSTLTSYVRGTALVALVDAAGIGLGLLVLDVPLWLSLTLLTFVGAFVPLLGATVAGGAAVLATLVTNGLTDAVIVLVVVLVVQQLEGNLLQPLIMGNVVRLHPLVIISAVGAGTLALGIAGAVLAVPVVAVGYRLVSYLSDHDARDTAEAAQEQQEHLLDPPTPPGPPDRRLSTDAPADKLPDHLTDRLSEQPAEHDPPGTGSTLYAPPPRR